MKFSTNEFIGKLHYHGCIRCHCKYSDACHHPELDADICDDCRQGRPVYPLWGAKPARCCSGRKQITFREDRRTYRLAGPGPWWQCPTCYRCFTAPGGAS